MVGAKRSPHTPPPRPPVTLVAEAPTDLDTGDEEALSPLKPLRDLVLGIGVEACLLMHPPALRRRFLPMFLQGLEAKRVTRTGTDRQGLPTAWIMEGATKMVTIATMTMIAVADPGNDGRHHAEMNTAEAPNGDRY